MQQIISFAVFLIFFSSVYFTPYRYTPKKLSSAFEVGTPPGSHRGSHCTEATGREFKGVRL